MALQFDATVRNTWASDLNTDIGASAKIEIFTGTPPANCAAASTGTLLGTLTGNAGGFGSASGGVLTANAITGANASGTGTAGYFRIFDSTGATCKVQGTVGTSGTDMIITNTAINSGDPLTCSSLTLTAPGA